MPRATQAGAGGTRARSRARSACSPRPATDRGACGAIPALPGIIDRAGLPDDGHLDLAGVLELVLDAPGDVLRQPDGFLVADALALDHDANLASGLEREGLGDPFERVGDALELLEAL